MSRLTDRVERDLREIAAGADPSPSAWESIVARLGEDAASEVALVPAPAPERSKRPVWPAVAAAAFVVVIGSIAVLTSAGDDPSISPADLTTTFVSPRNGFSVNHPDGVTVTPATQLWDTGEDYDGDGVDVVETGSGAVFMGASMMSIPEEEFPLDAWASIDDYIDDSVSRGGCGTPRRQQEEITIDGESGRIAECPNEIVATVVAGERVYQFSLRHERSDARAVFDAFAATIDLTPETAVDVPDLTTTFVSPTNGFSVKYLDRGEGTLTPAEDLWDPADEQAADGFDSVETGFAAGFSGASTAIPDGAPIDEWVDDSVAKYLPAGCYEPRSQQAEITIDGHSGRISECPNEIDATVVAGGRLYQFTLGHDRGDDARAFFDAFAATIDLRPEAAA